MTGIVSASCAPLIAKAQAGDAHAFEQLIAPHVAPIRRFTYSYCGGRDDADDIAQEALLKAFRSFAGYNPEAPLGAWLFTVTKSVCTDWYRKQRSRGAGAHVELDEDLAPESDPGNQQKLLVAKASAERLWEAIRELPAQFRVPVVLFDMEGLSYEEVARVEGVPVGTIRSRLARARKRLAAALTEKASLDEVSGTLCAEDASPLLRAAK